jgi:tetratricopeptide (TPR) repeat protein
MSRVSRVVSVLIAMLSASMPAAFAQITSGARAEESRALALATQMERSGQPGEAERVLIELLATQPTATGALVMLAQLGADRGSPDLVLPYAEAAAERTGYEVALVHQVLIRALADSGLADEALERARAWVSSRPTDTTGYGELSSALRRLGRRSEAISVLVDARAVTGDDDVFSQELALLYEESGDTGSAAQEWLRVLAWGDAGVGALEAHINTPSVDSESVVSALQDALQGSAVALTSRRGGLELALRLDRPEWSRELIEILAEQAPFETRWQLLRKYYLDARDREYVSHARWAAARLAAEANEGDDRLRWEAVEASLAMDEGDREHAGRAFDRILAASESGSETRRLAVQNLVVLRVDQDPGGAEQLIALHRREFPEQESELVGMVIRLSRAHVRRNDLRAAQQALDSAPSQPADASTAAQLAAQHGYLWLFEGNVERAREQFEIAGFISGGDPNQRTEILLFLDVMDRADPLDVAALGRGIYDLQSGQGSAAMMHSVDAWKSSGIESGASGLMRLSAGALARSKFEADAEAVRLVLVEVFPQAAETPGALLALARSALPVRPEASRRWLQRLIIDHPESALAPVARRFLSELDQRVPSGGSQEQARTL